MVKKDFKTKLKDNWQMITTLVAVISTLWCVFSTYQDFIEKNEELLATVKTTRQMALKSVIWNEEIPLVERTAACDIYLSAGYNSMTKKHCEQLVNESVSINAFLFEESEVK